MKNKVLQKMMLSCVKATEFIEKKHHHNLSFSEQFQLKLHTSMCNACRRFENQSELIEKALTNISNSEKINPKIPSKSIHQVEKKIIDKLKK